MADEVVIPQKLHEFFHTTKAEFTPSATLWIAEKNETRWNHLEVYVLKRVM
jgi:hypothetical protein